MNREKRETKQNVSDVFAVFLMDKFSNSVSVTFVIYGIAPACVPLRFRKFSRAVSEEALSLMANTGGEPPGRGTLFRLQIYKWG